MSMLALFSPVLICVTSISAFFILLMCFDSVKIAFTTVILLYVAAIVVL